MKFKDTNPNFDGNNKKQVDIATIMITNLLNKTFELMYEDKNNNIRIKYSHIFNKFTEILSKEYYDESNNNNTEVCGSINMEYFCIDHNCSLLQNGGKSNNRVNYYYKKYKKYKLKYHNISNN